jgi:hypothetical protein
MLIDKPRLRFNTSATRVRVQMIGSRFLRVRSYSLWVPIYLMVRHDSDRNQTVCVAASAARDSQNVAVPGPRHGEPDVLSRFRGNIPRNDLRKGSQVRFISPARSCSKSGKSAALALPLLKNPGSDPNTRMIQSIEELP